MSSDIQVFVRWKEQTIFAGEDVECTLTFKNVTSNDTPNETVGSPRHYRGGSRPINSVTDGANYSPAKSLNPFAFSAHRRQQSAGYRPRQLSHRPSTSINSPPTFSQSFPPTAPTSNGEPPAHTHKRSVSILSLDTDVPNDRKPSFNKPGKGHSRSASVQTPSRRSEPYGDTSQPFSPRSPVNHFPPGDSQSSLSLPNYRDEPDVSRFSAQSSPSIRSPIRRPSSRRSSPLPTEFKFPQAPPPPGDNSNRPSRQLAAVKSTRALEGSPTSEEMGGTGLDQSAHLLAPATKLSAISTVDGSTRSSVEFCSLSNNSTETLESEYKTMSMNKPSLPLRHRRHFSTLEPYRKNQFHDPETLLMGYAQINASFTLDGSLVDQSMFEDVKRKGVVGNHSRGERPSKVEKPQPGFWGNIGLNNLGGSISGLFSGGELNGLREMRGVSSSQSIPLLSTPQSLLFVDLRLGPGEEKSFSFSFTLPRGLPASHKGKAMKISYNLVIGTQRAPNHKEAQRVHRVNVPFRVLSGVDAQGAVLGHDLTRPYVVLRDEARVQKLDSNISRSAKEKSISAVPWNSATQFLSYVDEILVQKQSRRGSSNSIPSPIEPHSSHGPVGGNFSCKDAIDFAILRSNQSSTSDRSPNRFEISRNGRRVAVVVLNRPSHRLGETIVATVEFANAAMASYSIRGSLETCEKVSPTIALRSNASITRATRKIHATCFENTLFSSRVVFTPSIPVSATPTLITSGVSLEWQLRFEFVTSRLQDTEDNLGASGISLLEPVERDDRGTVFTSPESVTCETFEIGIPLTVYGGAVQDPGKGELRGISI